MFQKVIATLLAGVLALPAQQAANLVSQGSGGLKIVVVQGEGATNSIRSRTATAPLVEIRDESDKPVAGAEVVFQLPIAGPSGYFTGYMRNMTAKSGSDGRAAAAGMIPNEEAGRFNIKVTATAGGKTGSVIIAQSNVQGSGSSASSTSSKNNGWWKWAVAIGGAAAIGGAVAATRGNDSGTASAATATKTVTVTPGVISVGVPR